MFEVEDEPTETLHIYVIREAEAAPQPSLIPAFLLVGTLCLVIAMSVLIPYQPPVMRAVIRVPAVLLPARTFTAVAQVSPTGVKTYRLPPRGACSRSPMARSSLRYCRQALPR